LLPPKKRKPPQSTERKDKEEKLEEDGNLQDMIDVYTFHFDF